MKRSDKYNLKMLLFLAILSLITINITENIYHYLNTDDVYYSREINATFRIGDEIGIAAGYDVLNFGMAKQGGNSVRWISLYHEYSKPLLVKILYYGNISEVLSPIEPFYLEPRLERNVSLTANAIGADGDSYGGKIIIQYIKK